MSQVSAPEQAVQIEGGGEDATKAESASYSVKNATLDLETILNNYTGIIRLQRLLYVADHCPSLKLDALKMASNCVKKTYNTDMYEALHRKIKAAVGESGARLRLSDISVRGGGAAVGESAYKDLPVLDLDWIESTLAKTVSMMDRMESNLKRFILDSSRHSIWYTLLNIGEHYMERGDASNALKHYVRAQDYCSNSGDVVCVCLKIIKASVCLRNWTHVLSYVNKAESTPGVLDVASQTALNCAAGLAELSASRYKAAAKRFLAARFEQCELPDLLSRGHVATYGTLCALATFERAELREDVVQSYKFKPFLELEPQIRDVVVRFHHTEYAACLRLLDDLRDNLLLDAHVTPHLGALYAQFRQRALVQYLVPYQSACLRRMADAFNTPLEELEEEIVALIMAGRISARVDSQRKVLCARDSDHRSSAFEHALQVGRDYQRQTRMLLLRAVVVSNKIMVLGGRERERARPRAVADRTSGDAVSDRGTPT